jgi:hypothetical protein
VNVGRAQFRAEVKNLNRTTAFQVARQRVCCIKFWDRYPVISMLEAVRLESGCYGGWETSADRSLCYPRRLLGVGVGFVVDLHELADGGVGVFLRGG